MDVGVRVIRGPDWSHGNEDGGHGFVGTVVQISKEDKTCQVQWDYHGNVTKCLAEGEEGQQELRIIDIQQSGIYFEGITCDECGRSEVPGFRWKCVECTNFDLCTTCYMEDAHNQNHTFVRFESNMTACIACPARSKSKKSKIYGIGPDAMVKIFPPTKDEEQKEGKVVQYASFGRLSNGGVEVDWSGAVSKHKLGADGIVELTMVEPFLLGTIYTDHLPLGDLSLPKPSYINVGDKVQININTDSLKQLNEEFGGWNDEMEKIVGEIGVVRKITRNALEVEFQNCSRPWQIYRQACTKVSIVSNGDVVRVIGDVGQLQRIQGKHGVWQEDMRKLPTKFGKVYDVDTEGTLYVRFPNLGEFLLSPSCCVKQYNPPKLQFDDDVDDDNDEGSGASSFAQSRGATAATSEKKCGMVFDIGIRVVRGPNWAWDNQDGGEGHLGTVVEIGHEESVAKVPPLCVQVQWDEGYNNSYRVGYEEQYDLKIYDTSALGNKHDRNCTESSCEEPEIFGMLWQCDQCPNVALCSKCYHSDKHDIIHKFIRFDYAGHSGCPVPKRQLSSRQKVFGIFENAKVKRGKDWRWENQDGGDEKEGVVIAIVNFSLDTDHDGVEVTWESGHTNVYRLGYKGCVDVKASQSASGGFYYKDHLPIFKLPDQPRPGPSQLAREGGAAAGAEASPEDDGRLKKGDKVKIGVDLDTLQVVLKESKNWNERIVECIGVNGTVLIVNGQQITVDFGEKKWTLHEMTLAKIEQYVKDQVVQVENDAESVGRLQNGHGPWNEEIKKFLGKKGRVVNVDADGDVTVMFGKEEIKFNPECLSPARGEEKKEVEEVEKEEEEKRRREEEERMREEEERRRREEEERRRREEEERRSREEEKREEETRKRELIKMENDPQETGPLETQTNQRVSPEPDSAPTPEELSDDELSGLQEKLVEALKENRSRNALEILQRAPNLVHSTVENGKTPLTLACDQKKCDPNVVEAMLNYGARIDIEASSPLLTAVRREHIKVVELLLKKGANPNIANHNGQTAVHIAVQIKNNEMLKTLQDKCDFNICDKLGDSPVSDAITIGDPKIIDTIFQWPKINLKFENRLGFSPIHLAARKGDAHAVSLILQKCPDAANTQKNDGFTALHLAACMDHSDVAKILLQNNARTFAQTDSEGQTPLHIAAVYGSSRTAKCLMEDGKVNVNATDMNGNNALHLCLMERPAVMEFARMQDSGQRDSTLETKKLEIASLLIKHNVQTELKNNKDKTPLEVAASTSLREKVENLIKEKLNPSVRPKRWKCQVCEEEDASTQMKPCNCRICEDCVPKKLRKCPNCREGVSSSSNINT